MANRILSVLFKKKYTSGDTDTIYMRNRAKDVYTGEAGSATMDTIVTKVNGMATGATKVAGSSSNGYISINGTNTKVYTHPNSGATAGTYNQVTVNAQGHVTAGSNITTWTGSVSGSVANATSTFTRASSRANLTSGEKISISLGKISKWFADLKGMAFVDKVGVSNLDSTLTTQYNKRVTTDDVTQSTSITEAGWVADARVIRTLQNQINTLNSKATSLTNSLNNKANVSHTHDDRYFTESEVNSKIDNSNTMITTTRRCCSAYLGNISSLTSLSQLTIYMNGNTDIDISNYCRSGFWKVSEMSDALFKKFFPQSYANGLTYNPGDFTIFMFDINTGSHSQQYPKYATGLISSPRLLNNSAKTKYAMAYSFFTLWNDGIAATYELNNQTETINRQQYDF